MKHNGKENKKLKNREYQTKKKDKKNKERLVN